MKHVLIKPARGARLALVAAMAVLGPAQAVAGEDGLADAADCARLVREYKGGVPNAMLVRGWTPGDANAPGRASPGTFAVPAWHDLDTVADSIAGYCARDPKMNLAQAVSGLTSALGHKRLKTAFTPVKLRSDGASLVRYGNALSRMARVLLAKGASF